MDTLLLTGIETTAGANLALHLAPKYHIVGVLSAGEDTEFSLEGCEIHSHPGKSTAEVCDFLQSRRPDRVLHCGPASESAWSADVKSLTDARLADAALWADAADQQNCPFTLVTTDGVFTGPWMFHQEGCTSRSENAASTAVIKMEENVLSAHPDALIVRTHLFAWSPTSQGWLEDRFTQIQRGEDIVVGPSRSATPLGAGDLAALLIEAWEADVTGVCHIAGAERISEAQFLRFLALEFGLSMPRVLGTSAAAEIPHDFGCGETSLDSTEFRQATGAALPMLHESLQQLRDQQEDGTLDQLLQQRTRTAFAA